MALTSSIAAPRSMLVPTRSSTSRDLGPAKLTTAQLVVTSSVSTRRSGHSHWSHSSNKAATAAARPLVVPTRNLSSPVRAITPSSNIVPCSVSINA